MSFGRFLLVILLSSLFSMAAPAQTCEGLFSGSESGLEKLLRETSVSESALLKQATQDYFGNKTLPQKLAAPVLRFLETFQGDIHFRQQVEIEFKRREYKKILKDMGIETYQDARSLLRHHKTYVSTLVSVLANGSINALSYHYLGQAGFIVHVPRFRFFKPEDIPDAVLIDLVNSKDASSTSRRFMDDRFKHDADLVWGHLTRGVQWGILAYFAINNYQMITDPSGYVDSQMQDATAEINKAAFAANEQTIAKLKAKKAEFERAGNHEKAAKAQELIEFLEKENKRLSSHQ